MTKTSNPAIDNGQICKCLFLTFNRPFLIAGFASSRWRLHRRLNIYSPNSLKWASSYANDKQAAYHILPLQLALDCTENAIKNSTVELPLPTDDIMDLLNLCLTSTYFQYNGKHYKQLHGTAMGSPVSVVVAEIVMQNIEEQALATYTRTVPLWLR